MLDLNLGEKVSTAAAIPDLLNQKGWNAGQVASVWSVGPTMSLASGWDVNALKRLGGQWIFSKIWHSLKSKNQAGHYKRTADQDDCEPATKKLRLRKRRPSKNHRSGTLVATPVAMSDFKDVIPNVGSQNGHSNSSKVHLIDPTITDTSDSARRKKKARRSSMLATPKITSWLFRCSSQSTLDPAHSDPSSDSIPKENLSSNDPATSDLPSDPIPLEKPKKQRKRRRQPKKPSISVISTPRTPSLTQVYPSLPFPTLCSALKDSVLRRIPSMSPELRPRVPSMGSSDALAKPNISQRYART